MVEGEPGPCSTVGKGQTGECTKSGLNQSVLVDRTVSIKLICLLLSKKGKGAFNAHEKYENLYFSFLLKVSMNGKIFLPSRLNVNLALISWGFG